MKKYLQVLFVILAVFANVSEAQNWSPVPMYGGKVTAIKTYGANTYIGTSHGKIFFSSNNGALWTELNDTTGIGGQIVDIEYNGTVLLAISSGTLAIYSTNNGLTWQSTNLPLSGRCLYNQNGTFFMGTSQGPYSSVNGTVWVPANTGISTQNILAISGNGSTKLLAGASGGNVYYSSNNGTTWSLSKTGTGPIGDVTCAGDTCFTCWQGGGYIYRSINAGISWVQATGYPFYSVPTWYKMKYNGKTIVHWGVAGMSHFDVVSYSKDTSKTWSTVSAPFSKVNALGINATHVFIGNNDEGISTGTGAFFSGSYSNTGFTGYSVNDLKHVGSTWLAATTESNVRVSTNSGATWTQKVLDPSYPWSYCVNSIGQTPTALVATTGNDFAFNSGAFSSTNNGNTWASASGLQVAAGVNDNFRNLVCSGVNMFVITDATNKRLFYSANSGTSWSSIAYFQDTLLKEVVIRDNNTVYALTSTNRIYKSTNWGSSWNFLYVAGTGNASIFAYKSVLISTSPTNYKYSSNYGATSNNLATPFSNYVNTFKLIDSTLYAGVSSNGRIYQSNDYGKTWVNVTRNLLQVTSGQISCMDMAHDTLMVGTKINGAYYLNSGSTIQGTVFNNGTPVNGAYVKLHRMQHHEISKAIDSVLVTSGGNYQFTKVRPGNYITAADYSSLLPNTILTYRDSAFYWDSCNVIRTYVDSLIVNQDIHLRNVSATVGTGSISGTIIEGLGYGHRSQSPGNPISNIGVSIGKRPGGGVAKRTTSNASGNYSFTNLPVGSYWIFVDIPGLTMDSARVINITGSSSTFSGIDFAADSTHIYQNNTVGIGHSTQETFVELTLFPNPSKGEIILQGLTAGKDFIVYNTLGKVLLQVKVKQAIEKIDISSLPPGIYIAEENNRRVKFIKE